MLLTRCRIPWTAIHSKRSLHTKGVTQGLNTMLQYRHGQQAPQESFETVEFKGDDQGIHSNLSMKAVNRWINDVDKCDILGKHIVAYLTSGVTYKLCIGVHSSGIVQGVTSSPTQCTNFVQRWTDSIQSHITNETNSKQIPISLDWYPVAKFGSLFPEPCDTIGTNELACLVLRIHRDPKGQVFWYKNIPYMIHNGHVQEVDSTMLRKRWSKA